MTVHLHAATASTDDPRCLTECGIRCGPRTTTAYRDLDPERVNCPACIARHNRRVNAARMARVMSTPVNAEEAS